MTYEIVWSDEAFALAQRYLVDDPVGLREVFDAVDRLAEEPRPDGSLAWGGTEILRLRVGRYRVLYEVDEQVVQIGVIYLGRSRP